MVQALLSAGQDQQLAWGSATPVTRARVLSSPRRAAAGSAWACSRLAAAAAAAAFLAALMVAAATSACSRPSALALASSRRSLLISFTCCLLFLVDRPVRLLRRNYCQLARRCGLFFILSADFCPRPTSLVLVLFVSSALFLNVCNLVAIMSSMNQWLF